MRIASANPYTFVPQGGEYAPWGDMRAQQAVIARDRRLPNLFKRLATTAVIGLGTAGVGSALSGGGGAVSAIPGYTPGWENAVGIPGLGGAANTAAASGIGGALSHPLTRMGAQGVFGFLQQRSQNKANDRATQAQMGLADRQLAMETQRLADERSDNLAARAEDQRRWEAEEAYRKQILDRDNAYLEEDRGYQREREDRRRAFAPYQQMAMARLGRYLR